MNTGNGILAAAIGAFALIVLMGILVGQEFKMRALQAQIEQVRP